MYWLCITNERNWRVIREKNVWGVNSEAQISRVKKGDKLVIYLKQEKLNDEIKGPRIVALYEVNSEAFRDSSRIFDKDCPYRVRIKPIKIFEESLDFRSLIPKLSFIKKKKFWGAYLQRDMVPIPEEDWKVILDECYER